MTVATVLHINDCPSCRVAPVTVLARLHDNHATPRRKMTEKRLLGPSPGSNALPQEEILQHKLPFPPYKRTTARYLSIVRLRPSLSFDHLIERTAVRACEWIECRQPAPRHDTPPNTQFLIVICDSMLAGAVVQSSFDSHARQLELCAVGSPSEYGPRHSDLRPCERMGPFPFGLPLGNDQFYSGRHWLTLQEVIRSGL
jgi:hypothetical protein